MNGGCQQTNWILLNKYYIQLSLVHFATFKPEKAVAMLMFVDVCTNSTKIAQTATGHALSPWRCLVTHYVNM